MGSTHPEKAVPASQGLSSLVAVKAVFDKVVDGFLAVIAAALVFSLSYQVIARYVFHNPPAWSEELARYLFVWLTFVAAGVGFRANAHLGLDSFVRMTPPAVQLWIRRLVLILLMGTVAVVLVQGVTVLDFVRMQRSPTIRISMYWPYLGIAVGFALMLVELLWGALGLHPPRPNSVKPDDGARPSDRLGTTGGAA